MVHRYRDRDRCCASGGSLSLTMRSVMDPYVLSEGSRSTSSGPAGDVLHCFVHDLYDGERMQPEKLAAWQALRERYGNRDESRVDRGRLLPRLPEPPDHWATLADS